MATARRYRPGRPVALIADVQRLRKAALDAQPTNTTRMNDSRRAQLRTRLLQKVALLDQPTRDAFTLMLQLQGT